MRLILFLICMFSAPAYAGVKEAVDVTKSFHENFAIQAQLLASDAEKSCGPDFLKPVYHKAFDAWVTASIIQFGPIDDVGGPLSIAFWPDKKGFTAKTIKRLLQENGEIITDKNQFAEVSIAGKGFFALERLLFDPEFSMYSTTSAECLLVKNIAKDIAQKADRMNDLWQTMFSDFLLTAGEEDNTVFLSKEEAAQAYLTSVIGALEFIETTRLARPLGTLERPRPKRAEGWRSERPLRNIRISLAALDDMVSALGDNEAPATQEELSIALSFIPSIQDKSLQSITDISVRFKVESLLQMVINIKEAATEELSLHLGVTTGFNALDGD